MFITNFILSKPQCLDKSINNFKKILLSVVIAFSALLFSIVSMADATESKTTERRIPLSEYRDKMKAGWIGQMVGVGWGAPTEFAFNGVTIPEDKVPEWSPELVNVFNQDDMYVEMTFLRTMEEYGIDVSVKQAGIDFANSSYLLWVANRVGRENLRKGIAPPNSGHPKYNQNADAIDYQIEADYSGLIAPGLPNVAVALGNKFGRIMNYGDGLYGGQFVGAMYAEAFFENDPLKLVEAGLKYIPEKSQYAEAVRDVIAWYHKYPNDWEKTWNLINDKYHKNPEYRKFTSSFNGEQNIDAKLNGAFIVMGLLYGEGDPDKTVIISMRCGQDSDCNPSNAEGILFTTMGLNKIPQRFISDLDYNTKFSFTDYNFPELIDVCEKLALQFITREGGKIEKDSTGQEILVIPVQRPNPEKLEQSWAPKEPEQVEFTKSELAQIKGSKLYTWSLVVLVIVSLLIFKRNHKLKTATILIPWAVTYFLLELYKSVIPPDLLSTVNIIVIFQVITTIITLLLIFSYDRRKPGYIVLLSILIILATSLVGAIGATEGRYVASTKIGLIGILLESSVWFLGTLVTILIVRNNYNRIIFNLTYFISLFVFQAIGIYIITLAMANVNGPWSDLIGNFSVVLIGGLSISILLYLLSIPFLILIRYEHTYNQRVSFILRNKD